MTAVEQRNQLIEDHLDYAKRLAFEVCGRYRLPSMFWEDADAAAWLGLVQAAQRFDPSRGHPFVTCAYRRIKGEVIVAVRQTLPGSRQQHRPAIIIEGDLDSFPMPAGKWMENLVNHITLDQLVQRARLTARDRKIVALLRQGNSRECIALKTGISIWYVSELSAKAVQRIQKVAVRKVTDPA